HLAIFAFSLSLLGTFLVRSGVLTSVHAFASDPTRGLFILVLLGIVVGGSLILYAIRAPVLQDATVYALFSKENLLLVNNLLLVTASASILLGTLYPLILDALNLGKISVGPPYFASQFTPLMVPVFLIAGWAPSVAWRQGDAAKIARMFRFLLPLSIAAAAVINALTWSPVDITAMTGMSLGIWLLATSLTTFWSRARLRETLILGLRSQSRSTYGMTIAHLGLAVFLFGVVVSNRFSEEKTVRFAPGQTVTLAQYRFTFKGTESLEGPNYLAEEGHFSVSVEGGPPLQLRPQKRTYNSQGRTMTEAAIDPGLFRDLYIALGEPMDHGAWSVRLHYKPLIRWVWLGGLLMMTGGLLSASDRRYRLAATRRVALTLDTRGILTGSDSPCATSCRSPSSAS
nr:c-type cytochrome biogenesis protein CcmF [Methylotetracoccus sp.]